MKKTIIPVALLLASFFTYSCTKHSGDVEAPPLAVSVSFASPTEGAVYAKGDSISIQGMAVSKTQLHGYDLVIKEVSDTTVYFSEQVHGHNDTLQINHKWKSDKTTPINLEAKITIYLDHEGHVFTKAVGFKVQ